MAVAEDDSRRPRRDILNTFYKDEDGDQTDSAQDVLDIDGTAFYPDAYLSKLLKERSLTELMNNEKEMTKSIRSLDSDMQTMVYENYNKFISATDTIRKMKNDFKKMEDEMDNLATNMTAITEFSGRICSTLQDRRQTITKLSGVHSLLKKLQFLYELPARLNKCIEMEGYSQAVRYYTKARQVFLQYENIQSFRGIQDDCTLIVVQLSSKLKERLRDNNSTPQQLAECVDLLLQLDEPAESLCSEYLTHARMKLDLDLQELSKQLKLISGQDIEVERPADAYIGPMDILEFIDTGCNSYLSNMCLVIATYNDMFLNRQHIGDSAFAVKKLVNFVNELMELYFNYVRQRVQLERDTGDNTILVRALDRFHRRLQAMNKLLPDTDFSRAGADIVSQAARDRVHHYLQTMKQHFTDCLTDIRQGIAAPKMVTSQDSNSNIIELLHTTHSAVVDNVKSVLKNLQAFLSPDITFAMKTYFRGPFCTQGIHLGLMDGYFQHINTVCHEFCDVTGDKSSTPPSLLLLLSRFCMDYSSSTVSYLVNIAEEMFAVDDRKQLTPVSTLTRQFKESSTLLINYYVKLQGLTISQMLRKSVETRDWVGTIEPRNVRAVMKRVVEDITTIDVQVGQLYEEGVRKERSSDSSRRTHTYTATRQRPAWNYAPSIDNSLLSNINKLFSEKIEIFSPVEFSRVSILTGIVKISLKTFLECVRLRTFGRYGLQQIQVDTHYLQLYLWRFVSDENLVHFLLDEIVGSTVHRCIDPVLMEHSVVELICERG